MSEGHSVEGNPEGPGQPRGKVLVVDDDPTTRQMMLAFLDHIGFEGVTAGSGEAAVAAVEKGGCGIVLLDLKMPGMDGLEVTRRIRALEPPGGQPRILAFTGQWSLEVRVQCMAAGMDGYVPKPFTEQTLRNALNIAP